MRKIKVTDHGLTWGVCEISRQTSTKRYKLSNVLTGVAVGCPMPRDVLDVVRGLATSLLHNNVRWLSSQNSYGRDESVSIHPSKDSLNMFCCAPDSLHSSTYFCLFKYNGEASIVSQ